MGDSNLLQYFIGGETKFVTICFQILHVYEFEIYIYFFEITILYYYLIIIIYYYLVRYLYYFNNLYLPRGAHTPKTLHSPLAK